MRSAVSDEGHEGRHRVHVGGKHQLRPGMTGMRRPQVAAITFDRHALDVVAKLRQFIGEYLGHRGFLAGGGLDVDQLAGEGENVHLRRIAYCPRPDEPRLRAFAGREIGEASFSTVVP